METIQRLCRVVLVAILAVLVIAWVAGQTARVQVRQASVRSQPDYFMGHVLDVIPYDTPTKIAEVRGTWLKVDTEGKPQGWVNESALFLRGVSAQSDSASVQESAAQEELSLAGRGFTQQMEDEYRLEAGSDAYQYVDRIENDALYQIEENSLGAFLQEGGLMLRTGGAQ